MKKISIIFLAVLISCFIFTSCEKSATGPGSSQNISNESSANPFLTPENRQALMSALSEYRNQSGAQREFDIFSVFFTSESFGFFNDDYTQLVTFSTALDGNDYYLENPDGTVSVHVVSNKALGELYDFNTFDYYFGIKSHMVLHYDGPVMDLPVYDENGNIIGFIKMVLPDENSPATVWHGNGKVQLFGMGPKINLVAHLTANPGWVNVNTFVHLH